MTTWPELPEELPEMTCPRCGHEETDHDGVGMLACDQCGWCSHPDRYGGECKICGDQEQEVRQRKEAREETKDG